MSGNWSMCRSSSCLIVITFLTGLGMTIHEHRELLAYAEHAASHNLDFHPIADIYHQNLVFTLILSGGVIALWSAKSAKTALVLMTLTYLITASSWSRIFRWSFSLDAGVLHKISFVVNLIYYATPLLALVIGYLFWYRGKNHRIIAALSPACVIFQYLMWFLDTRRGAQIDYLGSAFKYPPVTINATFHGAGVEHIILLILCALSLLFTLIVASRENKHEGRKQQS
jgi:hypothetical protein